MDLKSSVASLRSALGESRSGSLRDLRLEEKQKVGLLMTKLANEQKSLEASETKRKHEHRQFRKLRKENKRLATDCASFKSKFE
jgi:hypothetical protein